MAIVTITDHDSIDAAEILRKYPDFFSEEVAVRMPTGTGCMLVLRHPRRDRGVAPPQ
jgi:hypothetical protein